MIDVNYLHITFKYMWENFPFYNRIVNKLAEEYYSW